MSEYTIEDVTVTPAFDMELILNISQETRMGGAVLERLAGLWERWHGSLQARRIDTGKIQYLAVWLGPEVEEAVDKAWEESPSNAFMDNALAQSLCMGAVHEILPQIEDAGCAPAPRPTPALREAMASLGVPYQEGSPTLTRRFAVVTHYPFKGGCEICHLQDACPKGQGQTGASSVELPGHER